MDKVFAVLFWVIVYIGVILLICDAMSINSQIPDDSSQQSARHPLV